MKKIVNLKTKIAEKFSMKNLDPAKKILEMRINREKRLLKISQAEYVEVLKRFNMADAKSMNVSLGGHFKLSEAQTLMTEDEKAHVGGVICISDGQPDVCYGLHETRHCSSSESYQQIHEQPREGALESSEVDSEISKGEFRYGIVL